MKEYTIQVGEVFTEEKAMVDSFIKEMIEYLRAKDKEAVSEEDEPYTKQRLKKLDENIREK